MLTTAGNAVTSNQEWRKAMIEELRAGKHLEFPSMKKFFQDFGQRHEGVSWSGVSTHYYAEKRNGTLTDVKDHTTQIAFAVAATGESSAADLTPGTLPPQDLTRMERLMQEKPAYLSDPDYQIGQTLKAMITRVEHYGALVETVDGHKTPGLIHKSNISYKFVTDPNHYFAFTDEVDVEILKIEADGRLSLSTRGFGLEPKYLHSKSIVPNPRLESPVEEVTALPANPPINTLAAKLGPFADKLRTQASAPTTPKAAAPAAPAPAPELPIPVAPIPAVTPENDEMREVYQYLTNIVGVVTPAARAEFATLVEEFSMFRFTKALTKVEPDFQKDLGLALAKQIRVSISQGL